MDLCSTYHHLVCSTCAIQGNLLTDSLKACEVFSSGVVYRLSRLSSCGHADDHRHQQLVSVHTLLPALILKMSQTPLPPRVPSSHPSMSLQDLLVNRIGHPCMAVSQSSTASCWFLKDLSNAVLECCCNRICLSRSMRRTTISARCAKTASCCVERERGCESIAHLRQNRTLGQ